MSSMDNLIMVDEKSVEDGFTTAVKAITAEERKKVLKELPELYVKSFGGLGFCNGRPAQIISPFEVPLGSLRRKWVDKCSEVREPQRPQNEIAERYNIRLTHVLPISDLCSYDKRGNLKKCLISYIGSTLPTQILRSACRWNPAAPLMS